MIGGYIKDAEPAMVVRAWSDGELPMVASVHKDNNYIIYMPSAGASILLHIALFDAEGVQRAETFDHLFENNETCVLELNFDLLQGD
jgi:hypothetical protein